MNTITEVVANFKEKFGGKWLSQRRGGAEGSRKRKRSPRISRIGANAGMRLSVEAA
jgi:hypothetical protein